MDTIGQRLRRYRALERGITRKKVEEISGIHFELVRALENDANMPNVRTLCKFCKAYKCTPNDLIPEWMYREAK